MIYSYLANKIVSWSIVNELIPESDRELYQYAYESLISHITYISTLLVFGWLFGLVLESLVYFVFIFALRIYTGGFHQNSKFKCFITSVGAYLLIPLIAPLLQSQVLFLWVLLILSDLFILVRTPIESKNKPLSDKEFARCKFRSRIILLLENLAILAMFFLGLPQTLWYFSLSAVVCTAVLAMIPEKVNR